jgi:hypothetical protein
MNQHPSIKDLPLPEDNIAFELQTEHTPLDESDFEVLEYLTVPYMRYFSDEEASTFIQEKFDGHQ